MCIQTTYTYTSSDCDCEYIEFVCCQKAKMKAGRQFPSCKAGPVIKKYEILEGGCWGADPWARALCEKRLVV